MCHLEGRHRAKPDDVDVGQVGEHPVFMVDGDPAPAGQANIQPIGEAFCRVVAEESVSVFECVVSRDQAHIGMLEHFCFGLYHDTVDVIVAVRQRSDVSSRIADSK